MSQALHDTVVAYIEAKGGGEGRFETPLEQIHIVRSFAEKMPLRLLYRPSLCVVVQGGKQIHIGEKMLAYGEMECLIVSMELPATGRIVKASESEPFIGVIVDFDVAMLREVLGMMETRPKPPAGDDDACVFVGRVDAPLADCIVRLIRMMDTPNAIPVLHPAIMREVCFWLLNSVHGPQLSKLALPETNLDRVARAVHLLRKVYNKTVRIEDLAEEARMSPSSLHQHFKRLTSMTPLQYQKQLRLLEARRLMVVDALTVAEAAYEVGYESASQFSRDYSRNFGAAPKRNVMMLRAALA